MSTRLKVVTPDAKSKVLEILTGVLQGDSLASFLFVIVLDYAMRQALKEHEDLSFTIAPRRSRRINLSDLDFADDIVLLSDQIMGARELLGRVETEGEKVGLHLNAKKTEYMVFNIGDHEPPQTSGGLSLQTSDQGASLQTCGGLPSIWE